MKKPFLSFYEQSLNSDLSTKGRTLIKEVTEDTDNDIVPLFGKGRTIQTNTIEDSDIDNFLSYSDDYENEK